MTTAALPFTIEEDASALPAAALWAVVRLRTDDHRLAAVLEAPTSQSALDQYLRSQGRTLTPGLYAVHDGPALLTWVMVVPDDTLAGELRYLFSYDRAYTSLELLGPVA